MPSDIQSVAGYLDRLLLCFHAMAAAAAAQTESLLQFLQPLAIDLPKIIALAAGLHKTFKSLAAESENQFLPTPISDSTLRPSAARGGR